MLGSRFRLIHLICSALLLTAAMGANANQIAQPSGTATTTSTPQSRSQEHRAPVNQTQTVPSDVSFYAKRMIGSTQQCMVGARTDNDGMNEKPIVYVDEHARGILWHITLPLPANTFQARATHCVGTPSTLYVLVQGDTQPELALSQTMLEVVALKRTTGSVVASKAIDVPNVSSAHTTWVEEGKMHFLAEGGRLILAGKYALLSDRDHPIEFSLKISQDLTR